jgi:uncharacterized protein YdcH (DUF465 family)
MHSHPPGQILQFLNFEPTRRTHKGEAFMEHQAQDEEFKARLLQSNDDFRTLAEQHAQLKHQIEEIEAKPHVTEVDELEEQRLKKLKLYVKDRMNEMLATYKHASV